MLQRNLNGIIRVSYDIHLDTHQLGTCFETIVFSNRDVNKFRKIRPKYRMKTPPASFLGLCFYSDL